MSSKSDVPGAAAAAAPESLAWGESPALYLSYGMVADKGVRAGLTSAVAAAPSFTVLSPPMGLDYFAVFDGGHLGAAAVEHLRLRLAAAISEQIDGELSSEVPWFGAAAPAHDVVGWWETVIQEAFRAVYDEVANDGEDAAVAVVRATAFVVALVLEKYTVIASSGDSKAVLCRDGEHVELTPAPERRANSAQDENQNAAGQVVAPPKLGNLFQITLPSGSSSVDNEPPAAVVIPELDVVVVERKAQDDEFLILGNHGLWGAVSPASACAFVRQRLGKTSRIVMPWEAPVDASGSPAMLAKELADKAVYAGSQGNVSVAIVLFKDSGRSRAPASNK